jgi:cation diffusion facilitator family transporter
MGFEARDIHDTGRLHGGHAREVSYRTRERVRQAGGASRTTVIVALVANAVLAAAKLAGALVSGSTVLLAEAAHSLADTTNQSFLLASITLSQREPSEDQPFGYGRDRFLWTFLAAVGMFVAGATFAVGFGIAELLGAGESAGGLMAAWITLAVSVVAEGASLARAAGQVRREARAAGKPPLRYARESRDPNVKMVLFEDSAALAGVAVAAAGIGLYQLTGQRLWDAAASIVVGLVLIGVAVWMARDSARFLVGAAATPEERARLERVLREHPYVRQVGEVLTMVLAPNALLVAAGVDFADELDASEVERTATELDDALRAAVPDVTEVFLDPWPGRG